MRTIPNRGLLLAALLLGIVGLAMLAPRADAARSFTTGVVDADSFEHGYDQAFSRTAASGAKFVKNNLYWAYVFQHPEAANKPGTELQPFDATDPASPYYTNWGPFDRLVRKADANELEVIFTVVNTPRWARVNACPSEVACTPKPADYADFAKAAASRYSGSFDPGDGDGVLPRVRFWQSWGEPNLYLFYKPIFKSNGAPSSPYTYRVLLNTFYDAVHSVHHDNFVIGGGLAPNAVPRKAIAPLAFTRMALCMTGNYRNPKPRGGCNYKVKADAWAVHPYTTGAPTHFPSKPDNMSVAALPRMVKLLRAANRSNRLISKSGKTQLWVTEFSWDSKPPDPGGLPSRLQTRWVAQAMYMMYRSGVQMMSWFGLRDQARNTGQKWSDTFESGLYLRGNTIASDKAKPVLRAFRFPFYAQLAGRNGISFWGRTPTNQAAKVDIYARPRVRGAFSRIGTVQANVNGIFTGLIRKRGYTAQGMVFAKQRNGQSSVAFGLWKTKDFYQPPFG